MKKINIFFGREKGQTNIRCQILILDREVPTQFGTEKIWLAYYQFSWPASGNAKPLFPIPLIHKMLAFLE